MCAVYFALTGCSNEEHSTPRQPDYSSVRAGIIGGQVDTGHPAVGFLNVNSCTATLIGRRTLLTSAHCVDEGEHVGFCGLSGSMNTGECVDGFAHRHPDYAPGWSEGLDFEDDIAIVRLADDFPTTTLPAEISVGAQRPPFPGQNVVMVGQGCTVSGTTTGAGTKRSGNNSIASVALETF
jgi:hypothetical protein